MKTDFWMDGWLDDSTQLCFLNSYGIDLLWCLASRRYEMIVKLRGFNCESETCNNNKGRSGWNLCCAFVSGLADNVEMSLSRRRSGNFVFVCVCVHLWESERERACKRERERENMSDFSSQQFERSVLMLAVTHISLNISHSVGVLSFPQQQLFRHRGRFEAQVQEKVSPRQQQKQSEWDDVDDVCWGSVPERKLFHSRRQGCENTVLLHRWPRWLMSQGIFLFC